MLGVPIGRLPGDFYVRRGNFSFYFPLATSIILSILLTLSSRSSDAEHDAPLACPSNPTHGSRAWRASTR